MRTALSAIDIYFFVKIECGLLQEAVLANRIPPHVRAYLRPGQSGYARGVEDSQLVLHEACAERCGSKLCTWILLGHQKKAFPKTWREALLRLLWKYGGFRGGVSELAASIMERDEVAVWLSGSSSITITQGLAEGGCLGRALYTSLPDSLVRQLEAAGAGIGLGAEIAVCWRDHVWLGIVTPIACVPLRDGLMVLKQVPAPFEYWLALPTTACPRSCLFYVLQTISNYQRLSLRLLPGPARAHDLFEFLQTLSDYISNNLRLS